MDNLSILLYIYLKIEFEYEDNITKIYNNLIKYFITKYFILFKFLFKIDKIYFVLLFFVLLK